MENGSDAWVNMLFTWAPIIVLIVFWIAFMRRVAEPQRRLTERSLQFMDHTEQLLERIAGVLEKQNRSIGS